MFRRANPSETEELTDLVIRSKSHWGYSKELIEAWTSHLTITPEFIDENLVICYVEADKVVAVYALVRRSEDEFELEHCWVDPAHIGKGIGRKVWDHAVHQVVLAGVSKLRIISDPNAAGFYERMGAVQQGEYISPESGRHLPLFYLNIRRSQSRN